MEELPGPHTHPDSAGTAVPQPGPGHLLGQQDDAPTASPLAPPTPQILNSFSENSTRARHLRPQPLPASKAHVCSDSAPQVVGWGVSQVLSHSASQGLPPAQGRDGAPQAPSACPPEACDSGSFE